MDKDEALIEFLKGLRTAVHNSQAYSPQHPYFIKSIREFKQKIDALFLFLDPVKINVSVNSLFLDNRNWDKLLSTIELAQFLHSRKIKSLEFKAGLSEDELANFFSLLSLSPNEIINKNGLSGLIKGADIEHISAEDLDYSRLLGSKGKEAKDIWMFLFKNTVEACDPQQICGFADKFIEGVNKNLNVKAIIEDASLSGELKSFLSHLKQTKSDKFPECVRRVAKIFLDSNESINSENIGKVREIFGVLEDRDFADILLSQIKDKEKINTLNFELFSQLAGKERISSMPSFLSSQKQALSDKALTKKIKELLLAPGSDNLAPSYRAVLASLVKDISFKETFLFDRSLLQLNYRIVLLDFLSEEKDAEKADLILKRIKQDWEGISKEDDYWFFRSLLDVSIRKKSIGEFSAESLEDLKKWIASFLEADMWFDPMLKDFVYLINSMEKTYLPWEVYFDKIFRDNIVSYYGLRQLLKFFPSRLGVFYEHLRQRRADFDFLVRVINVFAMLDLPASLDALKEIYSFGNELTRITVLKNMQELAANDPEFIYPLIKDKNAALRKEALKILIKDKKEMNRAMDLFLNIQSPCGLKNRLILENLKIIDDLSLSAAKPYVFGLSLRRFFWNKGLRFYALKVLERI